MANEGGLDKQRYYHGLLPREDIPVLLKKPGDFLVRMSEPTQPETSGRQYIISVMWTDDKTGAPEIKHFIVKKREDGMYAIDLYRAESIPKLVSNHLRKGDSITTKNTCIIRRPVERQPWELDHEHIILTKKLGEGAFGEVHLGILRRPHREEVKCAIKQAKLENMNKEQIKEFMSEARLMRHFECDFIVRLYGVAAIEPLSIVMELATEGTLIDYVKKHPNLDELAKTVVCMQASWGIEYIHSKNIIHRDIAARNCLYGNGKVKIADFGMSRDGPQYTIPNKKRAPIRWLAPETFKSKMYTFKTDVFSFGILCWEVYHNCAKEPYGKMTTPEVMAYVKSGKLLVIEAPLSPQLISLITTDCWAEPSRRCTQCQVSRTLEAITGQPRPDFDAESRKRREIDEAEEAAAAAAADPAAARGATTPQPEHAATTSQLINKTQMSVFTMAGPDLLLVAPTPPTKPTNELQQLQQTQQPSSEPTPSRENVDDDDHPTSGHANTGTKNKWSQGSKRKSKPGTPGSVQRRSRTRGSRGSQGSQGSQGSRGGDRGRKQPESC